MAAIKLFMLTRTLTEDYVSRHLDGLMPSARTEGLIVQELADELLVYDRDRYKAYCLNRTAAMVWSHCDGQTAATEIAQRMQRELETPVDQQLVWLALKQLSGSRLLQGQIELPEEMARASRRRAIQKLGLGAALGIPLIMAITAPTASAQASCVGQGGNCAAGTCCSGCHCNPQNACVGSC